MYDYNCFDPKLRQSVFSNTKLVTRFEQDCIVILGVALKFLWDEVTSFLLWTNIMNDMDIRIYMILIIDASTKYKTYIR